MIMQLNPDGKLAGTVMVTALLLEQTIMVPLSAAANVFDVPDSVCKSAP